MRTYNNLRWNEQTVVVYTLWNFNTLMSIKVRLQSTRLCPQWQWRGQHSFKIVKIIWSLTPNLQLLISCLSYHGVIDSISSKMLLHIFDRFLELELCMRTYNSLRWNQQTVVVYTLRNFNSLLSIEVRFQLTHLCSQWRRRCCTVSRQALLNLGVYFELDNYLIYSWLSVLCLYTRYSNI